MPIIKQRLKRKYETYCICKIPKNVFFIRCFIRSYFTEQRHWKDMKNNKELAFSSSLYNEQYIQVTKKENYSIRSKIRRLTWSDFSWFWAYMNWRRGSDHLEILKILRLSVREEFCKNDMLLVVLDGGKWGTKTFRSFFRLPAAEMLSAFDFFLQIYVCLEILCFYQAASR